MCFSAFPKVWLLHEYLVADAFGTRVPRPRHMQVARWVPRDVEMSVHHTCIGCTDSGIEYLQLGQQRTANAVYTSVPRLLLFVFCGMGRVPGRRAPDRLCRPSQFHLEKSVSMRHERLEVSFALPVCLYAYMCMLPYMYE